MGDGEASDYAVTKPKVLLCETVYLLKRQTNSDLKVRFIYGGAKEPVCQMSHINVSARQARPASLLKSSRISDSLDLASTLSSVCSQNKLPSQTFSLPHAPHI